MPVDISLARKVLADVYKGDVAYLMSDVVNVRERAIGTGIIAFDYGLLGIGGLPRGHFIEISGPEKTGKTTLIIHAIAACQAAGLVPCVIDPKGAVTEDVARAVRIGVDPSQVLIVPIDSSEDALQRTRTALRELRKKDIGVAFFWDDLGLTPSETEITPRVDKKSGKDIVKVGAKAKSVWQFCRALAGACYREGAVMVVTNQLTAVITSGFAAKYAEKETTAGGGGLRYAARIRVDLRVVSKIKAGKITRGQVVLARTTANAFFAPCRSVRLHLDFQNGYDSARSTILSGLACEVLGKNPKTKTYTIKGEKGSLTAMGAPDPAFLFALEKKMWPWIEEGKGMLVPEEPSAEMCEEEQEEDLFSESVGDDFE